jgi:DHA1 family multidrug resistance protein-like MFS transporter
MVFIDIYNWREQLLGLFFLGIFVGTLVVVPPFFPYLYYVQEAKYNDKGELKPEERMPIAIVGAFLIHICLFWFRLSSRASVHWIAPIIGSSFFGIAAILLFVSATSPALALHLHVTDLSHNQNAALNYLADAYPTYAASVLAGNDFIRSMFGAGLPLFTGAMYRNLGVGWASTLLALLGCMFVPVPILLYKYGERIRMASKRACHDYD